MASGYAPGSVRTGSTIGLRLVERTARWRLPSWIHLLEHFTQNALRAGESTITTLAESQTGHLTIATSPLPRPLRGVRGPPSGVRIGRYVPGVHGGKTGRAPSVVVPRPAERALDSPLPPAVTVFGLLGVPRRERPVAAPQPGEVVS